MKYTAHHYAQLLLTLTEDKNESETFEAIAKFVTLLKRHHGLPLARQIVRLFKKQYNQKHGQREIIATSAHELSERQKEALQKSLGVKNDIEYNVDPTVIGGIRLTIDESSVIDGTIKHRIETLFANL